MKPLTLALIQEDDIHIYQFFFSFFLFCPQLYYVNASLNIIALVKINVQVIKPSEGGVSSAFTGIFLPF